MYAVKEAFRRTKMKRLFPILIILAFLLSGCGLIAEKAEATPSSDPEPEFVFSRENFPLMAGSAALEPLAEAVSSLMLDEPRESVTDVLDFGNTAQSYRDLMSGGCGIVLAAEPSEAVYEELGDSCEVAPIAADALVFVVGASNPVDSLTTDEIVKIYTGEYTNWSQVGGDDVPIKAFTHGDWSGAQAAVERLVMKGADFSAAETENSENIFDGSEGAIGYSLYYYADIMQMAEGCKIISVDGTAPSAGTIASGDYPLLMHYCAAISASAEEKSPERILWEWLQGAKGQEFIASQGYVPAL
jgi:phosphate transport system substrate-binding protein